MIFRVLALLLTLGCGHLKAPEKKTSFFKVSWSKNLDPVYESGNLPIGLGAPRIFQDIVYQGSLSGVMSAYDLETGRVLWSAQDKTPLNGAVEFFQNHIAYGGANGRLYVRHYLTGKLKYAIDLGAPIESAPHFFNDRLLIYLRGHQIVHLDAETGKVLWAYKRAVPVTTTLQRTTRPLVLGNKIIIGFADGYVGALSVDEGLLLWETRVVDQSKFIDADLNPLDVQGAVIAGSPSGELKALNPENGAVTRSYEVTVQAHPVLRAQQLLLGTTDGEVLLMNLNGEIMKRVKISTQPISAINWWKDTIIAASFDGLLQAVDPLTLKVVDQFALGNDYSSVFSDIVVTEENLAIYSSRNRLYVFR
jgi:outer membrane protein assembly factor BamB